jgi:hypothetical protein
MTTVLACPLTPTGRRPRVPVLTWVGLVAATLAFALAPSPVAHRDNVGAIGAGRLVGTYRAATLTAPDGGRAAGSAATGQPGRSAGSVSSVGLGPVPLNDCVWADNVRPRLDDLRLSTRRVDVRHHPARLTVTVTATDIGGPGPASGIREIFVFVSAVHRPAINHALFDLRLRPDGSWTDTERFFPGAGPGQWVVDEVQITDRAKQRARISTAALQRRSFRPTFRVLSTRDTARPTMSDLRLDAPVLRLRPGHGGHIRVQATVHDNVFVKGVDISPDAQFARPVDAFDPFIELHRAGHGHWVGRVPFHRYNSAGEYKLTVFLEDGAGNVNAYGSPLLGGPVPGTGTVRVSGGTRDRRAPSVRALGLPRQLDLRTADQDVTLRARVRDRRSGVATVDTTFSFTDRVFAAHLVSGTRHNGVWQLTVHLSHCRPPTDTDVGLVAHDRGGLSDVDGAPWTVLARDLERPFINQDTFLPSRNLPLRFSWNEDVAGIRADTAPVVQTELGGANPVPVPGTWTCTTVTRADVDCFTGPVRFATYTPTARLTGQEYTVVVNPPGTLAVTDLAGNPAERFGWRF